MMNQKMSWREYKKKNFSRKSLAITKGELSRHEFYYSDTFKYSSVGTIEEYLGILKKVPEKERSLYECIRSNRRCKIYFDLENEKYEEPEKAEYIIKVFCEDFTRYIKERYEIEIDEDSYRISDSSGLKNTKNGGKMINSFHVVLNDHFVAQNNNEYMKQLYENFMNHYKESKPEWYTWVDGSVYTTDRLFRCLNCKKFNDYDRYLRKKGDYPDEEYYITNVDHDLPTLHVELQGKNAKKTQRKVSTHTPSKQYEKPPEHLKEKVKGLLEKLPYEWVERYENWVQICWIVHSIHPGLFRIFDAWSKKVCEVAENATKYDRNACIRLWNSSYKGCNGLEKLYKIIKECGVPLCPDTKRYGAEFHLMHEYYPRYPLAKTIENKYYNFETVINETDKFIKPEDFALPDLEDSETKINLYVKAGCGKGKSDQTLALCADLVEKGYVSNGIICLAPNKTLCDSLHFRFTGQRLIKTVLDDGETTYKPKNDDSWKAPHGYKGKVSPKDIGMIHYQDPEYEECLAPKDGSPMNIAIVINSIIKIFPAYVKRQVQMQREVEELQGKTEEEIEFTLDILKKALKDDYLAIVPSVLIIDEFFSFMLNMSSGTMNNTRRKIVSILSLMVKHCTYLVCLDANLNDECIDILRQLRPKESHTKFVWYKLQTSTDMRCLEVKRTRFDSIILRKLKAGKKIYICSNLKSHGADKYEALISSEFPKLKILSITSDTDVETKRLSSNAEKEFAKYDVVIVSPSVVYGLDYSGNHFDSIFGYYKSHSILANMAYQQLRRIRNPTSKEMYICYDNIQYDSDAASITTYDIDKMIEKRTQSAENELKEEEIYDGFTETGERKVSLFGIMYRHIVKFELESHANFSSWVRSYLCEEGMKYYSELYNKRLPDSKMKTLKEKVKKAESIRKEMQWAMYSHSPEYEHDSKNMEDPIGAQKFFHKISFGLQKIDQEFFEKYIDTKHHVKLENLKLFLMDELDIKDIYTERINEDMKEMVKFIDARSMITKLLSICSDEETDVFKFKTTCKTGEKLPNNSMQWVQENYKTIQTLFPDYGRIQNAKKCPEIAENNDILDNTQNLLNVGVEEESQMSKFEDKQLVTGLLTRILTKYLGISVSVQKTRKGTGTERKREKTLEVKDVDEMMELLMYSDSYYPRSDKLTEMIRKWAENNESQCRWYHLYNPEVTGKKVSDAAKDIYEIGFVEEELNDF